MGWKCWVLVGLVFQMLAFVPAAWSLLCPEPSKSKGEGVVFDIVEHASRRDRVVTALGFSLLCLGSIFQIIGLWQSP